MADLYAIFRDRSGRPELLDADINVFLDAGRKLIHNNTDILVGDFDENEYPLAVIYAAMHQYDMSYRNREGALEWLEALRLDLQGNNFNYIEEESELIEKMEG